jgi:predicted GNAT family acetyltransferase
VIRLLTESDREKALALLDHDHELNLIMINDIRRFGLEDGGFALQGNYYGAFRNGELGGVSVIYNLGSMFIYALEPGHASHLIAHVTGLEKTPHFLSARADWAESIVHRLLARGLSLTNNEKQEYMRLAPEDFKPRCDQDVRFAGPEDLDELIRLSKGFQVEYFGTQLQALNELARTAETRMEDYGIAVAERDGGLIAKAEIMARTEKAALIGGVFTDPEYRGRNYCFSCMSLLCESILAGGGSACLNVSISNLPALSVYRGLGFKKLYDYRMAHFA